MNGLDAPTIAKLAAAFVVLGQMLKAHPRIRNEWLRWMLPALGLVIGGITLLVYAVVHYDLVPVLVTLASFLMVAGGADLIKQVDKATPGTFIPSGTEPPKAEPTSDQVEYTAVPPQSPTGGLVASPAMPPPPPPPPPPPHG